MKTQMKAIIASAVVIALALSAVAGVTYSWFSDSEEAEIEVSTAAVRYNTEFTTSVKAGEGSIFGSDNAFEITNLAAAQEYSVGVKITNKSTIETAYRVYVTCDKGNFTEYDLKNIFVDGKPLYDASNGKLIVKNWTKIGANVSPDDFTITISTYNSYGDNQPSDSERTGLKIKITIEAYQGTYVSSAKIGDKEYSDVNDAIDAANDGDTVTLMCDTYKPITVSGKSITLDLNGKNIVTSNPNDIAIKVISGGKLTINGDGVVDGGSGGNNQAVHAQTQGEVVINGGTFTVGKDANGIGNAIVESEGGIITVNGGYFYTDYNYKGFYYVLNQNNDNPGSIIVNGGTFVDYNPSEGDDNLGGNFVAEGYSVVSQDKGSHKIYTVVEGTTISGETEEELQDNVNEAIKNSTSNVILPSNSNITLDSGIAHEGTKSRNVTFIGDGTQTIDTAKKAVEKEGAKHLNYQRGSTFTFKNLTIQSGEDTYDGIVCSELIYENCTIKGVLTLYGKATFINCTFDNTMANQYSIWTWGGTDVTFENCTFNTNGKAILLYGQATEAKPTNLVVKDCTFNDRNNGSAGKAAIEIGDDYDATYTLTINKITVNGFDTGKNTGSFIWANKDSMDAEHLTVTIDGIKVQ